MLAPSSRLMTHYAVLVEHHEDTSSTLEGCLVKAGVMSELHKVQENELQVVNRWLQIYLPESWNLYGLTRSALSGRWEGQTFYTLGWPDIRGVVSGEQEPNHPCQDFYSDINFSFMFAPNDDDVMILLSQPEVVDWSKRFVKAAVPERTFMCVEKAARANGVEQFLTSSRIKMFYAKPEDVLLPPRPLPEGCRMRPLKADSETEIDYCTSTWPFRTANVGQYFRALVQRLPSACVADDQDKCLSFEIGTEFGAIGFLHTREEARGKGLAKAVIARLAEEHRKLGLDLYAGVMVGNEVSYSLHSSLGFKDIGNYVRIRYNPQ